MQNKYIPKYIYIYIILLYIYIYIYIYINQCISKLITTLKEFPYNSLLEWVDFE